MPYNIYEQQQQLLERRVIFDENNPYGTTELRNHQPIYNETRTDQSNGQTSNGLLNNSILNGQSHNSTTVNSSIDQLINNTETMNLNQQTNTLLNNSIQMSANGATANSLNTSMMPQFAPILTNNLDPNVRWRDPDLHEVIEFLNHPNPIVKCNAAAYLQHLSFMDDSIKQKARALGSIAALINALNYEIQLLTAQANQKQFTSANQLQTQPSRDVQRNCLGALRNLSFGRQNDDNKRAIKAANGIQALVSLLKYSLNDKELKELITGILWNLSSSEEIKTSIIDEAVKEIVNYIIIPGSGWDGRVNLNGADGSYDPVYGTGEIYWATVFRNSTGVLRNVSSAGEYAR